MKRILASILLMTLVVSQADAGQAGKRQGQGPGMQGNGPRLAHMQQNLGLTQEQVEQIRAVREQGGGREEIRALLSEEQLEMLEQHRAARQAGQLNAGMRPRDGRGRAQGPGQGPAANAPDTDTGNG